MDLKLIFCSFNTSVLSVKIAELSVIGLGLVERLVEGKGFC